MAKETAKRSSELQRFGLVFAAVFTVLAGVTYWRDTTAWPYLAGAAAFFLFITLALPEALSPIETAWMKFARVLSTVTTYLILTFAFFLVVTPLGLLLRLLGKHPLKLQFDSKLQSYWDPVEEESVYNRPGKPY